MTSKIAIPRLPLTKSEQGTALCRAISTGNATEAIKLLKLGCDVNAQDSNGAYPLLLAICGRQSGMALLLMAFPSCDLNVLDPKLKQNPLCSAVMGGLSDVVEAMVYDKRCNITQVNCVGDSALHLALLCGHRNIVKMLARHDELRFLKNNSGQAPVHIVVSIGDYDSFSILYPSSSCTGETFHRTTAGGDSQEEGSAGQTKRMTAIQQELNQRDSYTGDTALHVAVRGKHFELALRMIDWGCNMNIVNSVGETALFLACAPGNTDFVLRLLKSGACPNTAGHTQLQKLIERDVCSPGRNIIPLLRAVRDNNLELVKALCKYGADVNKRDTIGFSPLIVALRNGAEEMALYMLSQTTEVCDICCSMIHVVSQFKKHAAEITTALLDRGCSFNRYDWLGYLPLHQAVLSDNTDMVRVLLERGASPSACSKSGILPLVSAARRGFVEMAALLLRAGADVNGADRQADNYPNLTMYRREEHWSPFRRALESNNVNFACYLVEEGCDLSKEKYLFVECADSNHCNCQISFPPSPDDSAIMENDDREEEEEEEENDEEEEYDDDYYYDDDDDDDGYEEDPDDEEDGIPHVPKKDKGLFHWLHFRAHNPRSLMQISIAAVRRVFRQGNRPFTSISGLPLPKILIAKLLYQIDEDRRRRRSTNYMCRF